MTNRDPAGPVATGLMVAGIGAVAVGRLVQRKKESLRPELKK